MLDYFKKISKSKVFIIIMLLVSITVFSILYGNVHNDIDNFMDTVKEFINSPDAQEELGDIDESQIEIAYSIISKVQSPYILVPVILLSTIFTLFMTSIIYKLTLKRDERIIPNEEKTSYNKIIDVLFITLYVLVFKYIFNSLYILTSGKTISHNKYLDGTLKIIYFILPMIYFIYKMKKRSRKLSSTISVSIIFSALYAVLIFLSWGII